MMFTMCFIRLHTAQHHIVLAGQLGLGRQLPRVRIRVRVRTWIRIRSRARVRLRVEVRLRLMVWA